MLNKVEGPKLSKLKLNLLKHIKINQTSPKEVFGRSEERPGRPPKLQTLKFIKTLKLEVQIWSKTKSELRIEILVARGL
ncbi:hypothetical protein Hanom_Chr16g01478971 [Helianthus anomalus]